MKTQKLLSLLLLISLSSSAVAANCSTDIEGNDAMQFNKSSIVVDKTCKEFTVNLKHTGKLAKAIMGHNWVLSKTADMQAISVDGIAAGIANEHIKPGDTRVLAATKVVGGGESTSVTFPVSKIADGQGYSYFCSFPGHFALMKGTIEVK